MVVYTGEDQGMDLPVVEILDVTLLSQAENYLNLKPVINGQLTSHCPDQTTTSFN